jgi:hypothetical protein
MVLAPFQQIMATASLVAIILAEEGASAVDAEESRLGPDRKYEVRRQKAKAIVLLLFLPTSCHSPLKERTKLLVA